MKHNNRQGRERGLKAVAIGTIVPIALIAAFLIFGMPLITSSVFGYNQTVSSQTILNVTNSRPTVTEVYVFDNETTDNIIDLVGGSQKIVYCNATVNDYNGASDINNATAALYHSSSSYPASDSNSDHYTNGSCGSCIGIDTDNATCSCRFNIWYYAVNNTWTCNITVYDFGGESKSTILHNHGTGTGIVNSLISIEIPPVIDFGNLTVGSLSDEVTHNVTNYGNVPVNITVRAYGGDNESAYSTMAMICRRGQIALTWEKYTGHAGSDYTTMTSVTDINTQIQNFVVGKRTDPNSLGNSTNSTYWRLQVPGSVAGMCNGTVIFTGLASH